MADLSALRYHCSAVGPIPASLLPVLGRAVIGMNIQRTDVVSSAIASVGYEPSARLLEVEFSSGKIYRYFNVPPDAFEGLLAAKSKGVWFNRKIRDRFSHEARN